MSCRLFPRGSGEAARTVIIWCPYALPSLSCRARAQLDRCPGVGGGRDHHRRSGAERGSHRRGNRPLYRRPLHRPTLAARHARHRARAFAHLRLVCRRECLLGAVPGRRARQHRGQGEVSLGAAAHLLLFAGQHFGRAGRRPWQPLRCRQARGHRWSPLQCRFRRPGGLRGPRGVGYVDLLHHQGKVPTADHSRIQQRVPQLPRHAARAYAQHQAALLRRRNQRGCGLVPQGPHLGGMDP